MDLEPEQEGIQRRKLERLEENGYQLAHEQHRRKSLTPVSADRLRQGLYTVELSSQEVFSLWDKALRYDLGNS
jgi:hypothetical protein